MIRIEHNIETGEITEIELTDAEIAEIKANAQIMLDAEAVKAAEKAELFAKLGITEDEAKLLFS